MKTAFLAAALMSLTIAGLAPGTARAQAAPAPAPAPAQAQTPAAAQPGSTLPGGASTLKETFDDWIVGCGMAEARKVCALSQQQTSQQTRQLVLAVELALEPDGKLDGTLVLPFGLALERGVTLQVDDLPSGAVLRFRTCLPVGCLVNLSFDEKSLKALRGGTILKASAIADDGKDIVLPISLKGFGAALDRIAALLK